MEALRHALEKTSGGQGFQTGMNQIDRRRPPSNIWISSAAFGHTALISAHKSCL